MHLRYLCGLVLLLVTGVAYGTPLIAPGGAQSPAAQRKQFHLPPGFEIQLVASEPDIQKPMNLNFDAKGRLWVSHSIEYPFAAPDSRKARDGVTILSDFGEDGRARKVQKFAEGLNIPIGLIPTHDGAIIYSINSMVRHYDTDGDGKSDRQEEFYTGFGMVDTHGMNNSFTRGLDGWIYAAHGFRNTSNVIKPGQPGQVLLKMNSGNTYRFWPDGSKIQQWTHGQVNPFGLAFDPLGNLYSADCHSMPVYMLLRFSYYPSFGKPHDGLGFGPTMIDHNHGSTGIAGVAYYTGEHYPADWEDNLIIGNPVTGRVHRDGIKTMGSTYQADTKQDFVRCDDAWFRPVDIQLGPDGAIYIADFYNKIIGHYEVDLKHPERDRHRGRIWRIVYRGEDKTKPAPQMPADLTKLKPAGLYEALKHANLTYRTLATHEMVDRLGEGAAAVIRKAPFTSSTSAVQRLHSLWVIERTSGLTAEEIAVLSKDESHLVRTHLMKALSERGELNDQMRDVLNGAMKDENAFVRRAGVEAAAVHPHLSHLLPIMDLAEVTPGEDTHLHHMIRIAFRNQLRLPGVFEELDKMNPPKSMITQLALRAPTVGTPSAARFVLKHLEALDLPAEQMQGLLRFAIKVIKPGELPQVITYLNKRYPDDRHFHALLLEQLIARDDLLGEDTPDVVEAFMSGLIDYYLDPKLTGDAEYWSWGPVVGRAGSPNPFVLEQRKSSDGQTHAFLGSIHKGEQRTGHLSSRTFTVPERLSFYIAGHDGFPDKPMNHFNKVELIATDSGEVLALTYPPRNDTAQKVNWDLKAHAGKQAYVRITDADTAGAYAWLAVGRFDPAVVKVPRIAPDELATGQIGTVHAAVRLKRSGLADKLNAIYDSRDYSMNVKRVALNKLAENPQWIDTVKLKKELEQTKTRHPIYEALVKVALMSSDGSLHQQVVKRIAGESSARQQDFAGLFAQRAGSVMLLLDAIEKGGWAKSILNNQTLYGKLRAVADKAGQTRLATLLEQLPPVNKEITGKIDVIRKSYQRTPANAAKGLQLFKQFCAACHQVGGEGALIGPQLDGVWNRSEQRLLEDILDPNRNVDGAFRLSILTLKDGRSLSGMIRNRTEATLMVADPAGNETEVAVKDVVKTETLALSLMPPVFHQMLNDEQIHHLMDFLYELKPDDD